MHNIRKNVFCVVFLQTQNTQIAGMQNRQKPHFVYCLFWYTTNIQTQHTLNPILWRHPLGLSLRRTVCVCSDKISTRKIGFLPRLEIVASALLKNDRKLATFVCISYEDLRKRQTKCWWRDPDGGIFSSANRIQSGSVVSGVRSINWLIDWLIDWYIDLSVFRINPLP